MSLGHNKSKTGERSSVESPAAEISGPVSVEAQAFVDLFYPVHYKIGIGIEDALRGGGRLSRHQVAILWLIRSEGAEGRSIPRKDIERSITRWFEIGNSAISKALRVMARPPYRLLEIREHPLSGRERQVVLTARGVEEIARMVERGQRFVQTMVDRLSPLEAGHGVHFLTRVSDIIDQVEPAARQAGGVVRGTPRLVRKAAAIAKKTGAQGADDARRKSR